MGPDELLSLRWHRRGLLFEPPLDPPWSASHGALPCIEPLGGGRYRLYLSTRNADNRSHVARLVIRAEGDRLAVESVDERPVLAPGVPGAFDQDGVTPSTVVTHGARRYLYYTGWTRQVSVPFSLAIGLAVSDDGGETFARVSEAPIVGRSDVDPFQTASPAVLIDDAVWRMWYVSGTGWSPGSGAPKPHYNVRYAESDDGVRWRRDGVVALDFEQPGEHAFGRPCVVAAPDGYVAWYCVRGEAYRLGVAHSPDGTAWTREDDRLLLQPEPEGWESDMTAYPWVFEHDGTWFLLYNGNGYGRTGVGYAVASGSLPFPGSRPH